MSLIVKRDTNGVKPLLQTGEFGYDNYPAGGDSGRVYVGTGSENIPLAKKAEMLAVDGKADVHIARVDNPHEVTKAQVGLGNVENLAPADMPISSAGHAALNAKANKTDADLLGVPTAPTAAVGTNSTQLATTAFVQANAANTVVQLTGNQTIAGVKTFTSNIVGNITGNSATATKLATARTINGVAFDGSANIAISNITNPSITGSITEQVYNLTGTAINPANGTIQYKTVSANTTFTESLTSGQSVLLRLINANSYTITFPPITWVGAVAPILTANCAIVLWKEQSTLYGAYVGTLV